MDWRPPLLQAARLLCPWGFSRQEYWSGLKCPLPGIFLTRDGTQFSHTSGRLFCLSCQLPTKWVLKYTEDAWYVYFCILQQCFFFFLTYQSVLFLFTRTLSRMRLSKRTKLTQKELLSGIAVKVLSGCQFIQNTRGWVFAFNYNIYLRKNKWLASFCHGWYSVNSNFRAVGIAFVAPRELN